MGRKGPVPEEDYTIPFGVADVKRSGDDVTVVRVGVVGARVARRAEELAKEGSRSRSSIRARWALDKETIRESVRKTGRLVIADEAGQRVLLGRGCGGCYGGCGDVRAPEGPGEAGLCAPGADTV